MHQFKLPNHNRILLICVFVFSVLFSIFLGYILGQIGSHNLLDALPNQATYTVEADRLGGYRAIAYTGRLFFQATDIGTVLNACLANMTDGGKLFIACSGETAQTIHVSYNGISICGINKLTARINYTGSDCFFVVGNLTNTLEGVTFNDLYLDAGANGTSAIYGYMSRSTVKDCNLAGSQYQNGTVSLCGPDYDRRTAEVIISSNKFVSGGGYGILVTQFNVDVLITDNFIAAYDVGIYLRTVSGAKIYNNHVYFCGNGLYSVDSIGVQIVGNFIDNSSKNGVLIESSLLMSKDIQINDNDVWGSSRGADNTYSGIKLSGSASNNVSYVTIENNRATGTNQKYGIEEAQYVSTNMILNNYVLGNHEAIKVLSSSISTVAFNKGYNPIGYLANAFTVDHLIVDSGGTQNWANSGETYICTGSPKIVYLCGNITGITVNGQAWIFPIAEQQIIPLTLQPGDSFSCTFGEIANFYVYGQ
jgi:hypothetical protein